MNRRQVLVLWVGVAVPACAAMGDVVEFYGGDFDGQNSAANYTVTNGADTFENRVYDDFTHASTDSIASLFGNFLTDPASRTNTTGYAYEIRAGASGGAVGAIRASGTANSGFSWTSTGRLLSGSGLQEWRFEADVPDFGLAAGIYYLHLRPLVTSSNGLNMYLSATTGTNGIGSPRHNGNAFTSSGVNRMVFIASSFDFSQGVVLVPVPTAVAAGLPALIGAGLVVARRRRFAGRD